MKKLLALWKREPKVRFYARTIGVAIAGYIVAAVHADAPFTLHSLVAGVFTAAITAVFGLVGLEPKVGIKADVQG
jgi:hypothetical protein